MQCPNCGSDNREGAKFCDECGIPLGGAIARTTSEVAQWEKTAGQQPDVSGELEASDGLDASGGPDATGELGADNESTATAVGDRFASGGSGEIAGSSDADADGDSAGDASTHASEGASHGETCDRDFEGSSDEGQDADSLEASGAGADGMPVSDGVAEADRDASADVTRAIGSAEDMAQGSSGRIGGSGPVVDPADITGMIGASQASDAGITRQMDEDEFAGFTKTPDDGYSFGDPLTYTTQGAGFTMKMPRVEQDQKEKSRDFMASQTVPKKSNAKLLAVIAGIVALVAVVVIGGFALGLWGGRNVPDVSNMTETDARAVLEEAGFVVRSTQVKSDDTEGLVLVMDPSAGSRVPEGSEVVIHIATARLIPDIVGKKKDEAAAALADAGYDNIKYDAVRSDGEEGIVLSVTPEPGARAKSNSEVAVGVSEPFRVPDISEMGWDDAMAAIEEAGLVPQVVYINTEYYYEGSIIGTSPEAGAVVPEGSVVSVNVAQSRATLLTNMTQNMLVPGSTINVNGYNFTIDALVAVSYAGNDTVSFTFTGRPYVSLLGETLHAGSQTVSGNVVWSPSNEVVSIS